uniref:protein PHOX1-like n=1 Tax=Erigeron canadensis TaxID=72917 RepID=UPI001CB9AC87|nr:protein PHOX1-like [Erigeron canadensis]XP_043614120.1 protein PHOX1-like [Erigeron canadensis]
MGKPTGKKKLQSSDEKVIKHNKTSSDRTSKNVDEDTAVFIQMSQETKEEGNKLFQKHDYEGAMLKYEKALKLLPKSHIDVAYLRSRMASCYMQLGLKEYPRAIQECNLALEVAPKYSKALLNRAKCYSALSKIDLALRDVNNVLTVETGNVAALEMEESLRKTVEGNGLKVEDVGVYEDVVEPNLVKKVKALKDKVDKKKRRKKGDAKVVREDKEIVKEEKVVMKTVKMVVGDDIRWAEIPVNCSIGLVREIVRDRFPGLHGVLIKYKDQEGDLVTIVNNNELRLAEKLSDPQGFFKLYLAEVSPDKEPLYEGLERGQILNTDYVISSASDVGKNGEMEKGTTCIEEWIVEFARLFKNHVGFDANPYLDLHELGMELYSEAMEDTITNESSQNLFDISGDKFQEMSALAMFNWGNVHMNKARKLVAFAEDGTQELVVKTVKDGYEWAKKEYTKAGKRYEESLKVKPDFYEGHLALGLQQFELAKLIWHYTIGSKADLEGPSIQILDLYNKAEDNMEKGMQIWEELEERRLNGLGLYDKYKDELANVGLESVFKDDEAAEQAVNIRSQIYILWGTLLYERSVVEYKLSLPSWEECLEVSVEKYELAGASHTDIAVIVKNHCSNGTALEGLSFKIDEIVQAWNEMFDTKRWQTGVPTFRLEPLFRRRVPKLHSLMEHF